MLHELSNYVGPDSVLHLADVLIFVSLSSPSCAIEINRCPNRSAQDILHVGPVLHTSKFRPLTNAH